MSSLPTHAAVRRGIRIGDLRRTGMATLAGACALVHAVVADAQELEFPISPNPVGSGARAAGMANAFVAIADDATAASWNPAGLVQLERPEISIVGSYNAISEKFNSNPPAAEIFGKDQFDQNYDLNFMSVTYPLPWTIRGRNMTLSLSFQQKYDLSRDYNTTTVSQFSIGGISTANIVNDSDFEQSGGLSVITPAFAMELTERLAVGVAVNFWRENPFGDSGWDISFDQSTQTFLNGNPVEDYTSTLREKYENISGENVSIGVLWNATERLSLGMRYDSHLKADADFESTLVDSRLQAPLVEDEDRKIALPAAWAFGAAYRISDRLTVSMDLTTRKWDDFYVETASGEKFSLVDSSNLDNPDEAGDFDRTYTVRLGGEYVFVPKQPSETMKALWTLRGGLFFDQEPASGRPSDDPTAPGDGDPDNFYGFAAGFGVQVFQRVNLDMAYEFRYGNNVNRDFLRGVEGFEEDVIQHRVLLSTIIYF